MAAADAAQVCARASARLCALVEMETGGVVLRPLARMVAEYCAELVVVFEGGGEASATLRAWSWCPAIGGGEWQRAPRLDHVLGAAAQMWMVGEYTFSSAWHGESATVWETRTEKPATRWTLGLQVVFPEARTGMSACVLDAGRSLALVGGRVVGRRPHADPSSTKVRVLDVATQTWSRGPDLPFAVSECVILAR